MKKFKFNLTALLKIRKRYEDRVQQELADQQRRVEEEKLTLHRMMESRDRTDEKIRTITKEEIDVALEKAYNDYLQALQKRIHESKEQLSLLKEELDRRRQILIKAQQDVAVLEKLKDNRFEIYKNELSKEEQAFLDEVALSQRRVQNNLRRTP